METSGLKPPLLLCPRWPPPPRRGGEGRQARSPQPRSSKAGASHPLAFSQPLPSHDRSVLQAGSSPFPRQVSASTPAQLKDHLGPLEQISGAIGWYCKAPWATWANLY